MKQGPGNYNDNLKLPAHLIFMSANTDADEYEIAMASPHIGRAAIRKYMP